MSADFEKSIEKILNNFQLSISYFQKAHNSFKELKYEEKMNASLGFVNLLKYISESERGNEEILLVSAKKLFNKAKIIYQEKGTLLESLKMVILENRILVLLIGEKLLRTDDDTDFMNLVSEFEYLLSKIFDEIKNQPNFPEIYLYQFLTSTIEFNFCFLSVLPLEKLIKGHYIFNILNKIIMLIKI
ncbi:MAG: hypothetical protein ACFFD2_26270, partial [Promethearchaeota archaeon]